MKRLLFLLSVSLVFLLSVQPASAGNSANDMFYLSEVFNACSEPISFEGTVHYLENATSDGNGGFHVKIQWNYVNVKGSGMLSGEKYVLKAGDIVVYNAHAGETLTGPFTMHAISLGGTSDMLIHGIYHITIDSNGNVVAEVSDLKANCFED